MGGESSSRRKGNKNSRHNEEGGLHIVCPWDDWSRDKPVYHRITGWLTERGLDPRPYMKVDDTKRKAYSTIKLVAKKLLESDANNFLVLSNDRKIVRLSGLLLPMVWAYTTENWAYSCGTKQFRNVLVRYDKDEEDEEEYHIFDASELLVWREPNVMVGKGVATNAGLFIEFLEERYNYSARRLVTVFVCKGEERPVESELTDSLGRHLQEYILDTSKKIEV